MIRQLLEGLTNTRDTFDIWYIVMIDGEDHTLDLFWRLLDFPL